MRISQLSKEIQGNQSENDVGKFRENLIKIGNHRHDHDDGGVITI